MTIFSLGNACDLEHFSSHIKMDQENSEDNERRTPVVPMPTDPPFQNTNYTWKSDSAAVKSMTSRNVNDNTFNPIVGGDSQGWGSVNFGPDYWGESSDEYSFKNKLLNNSGSNSFQQQQYQPQQNQDVVMPGMRPQGAFMPTSRNHIVQNEDMGGRDKEKVKQMMIKAMQNEEPVIEEPIVYYPKYNKDKVEKEQKNNWFYILALLIVIVGYVMYKTNYF